MTLNSLEVTKCCKNYFILFLFFCLQNSLIFTFSYLELILDKPAMVLRYLLHWSLQRSVKRAWTGSTFSTNESAWNVVVTGSPSRVWTGPKHRARQIELATRLNTIFSVPPLKTKRYNGDLSLHHSRSVNLIWPVRCCHISMVQYFPGTMWTQTDSLETFFLLKKIKIKFG